MNSKNDYLYKISVNIYYFISLNVCFVLSNILFILAMLFLEMKPQNMIYIILSLIPSGPSFTAMNYIMNKLINKCDIEPYKDYISAYKLNFKDSMKIWSIQLIFLFIISIDIFYILLLDNAILKLLLKPILLIFVSVSGISVYSYSILSKFSLNLKDLIKLSLFFSIKKLPLTFINVFIIFGIGLGVVIFLPSLIPIISVILSFFIMKLQQNILNEVEEIIIISN